MINNVDVATETDPGQIRDALVRQLYSPVRWVETVIALRELGATIILEPGPGRVLTGLNKRIDRALTTLAVHDSASLDKALTESKEKA